MFEFYCLFSVIYWIILKTLCFTQARFSGLGRVVESHGLFNTEMEDHNSTLFISRLLTKDLAETILHHS